MLTKRIIPCLDVCNGKIIKGVQFKDHQIVGDIIERSLHYRNGGADEIVFYDILASCQDRLVDKKWVLRLAEILDIPMTVAGGISNVQDGATILNYGADKISINSPAIERPQLIDELVDAFGSQAIVIGIDSKFENNNYYVYKYTGDTSKAEKTKWKTFDWAKEVQARGAGEIVLNCMNRDGITKGFDIAQLIKMREILNIPLIASGGAGTMKHFLQLFKETDVDGGLAATVFHKNIFSIRSLKKYLSEHEIEIRI